MKKTVFLIAMTFFVASQANASESAPKTSQTHAEKCKQFADSSKKRDLVNGLKTMGTKDLKALKRLFKFVIMDHDEHKGILRRVYLDCEKGHLISKGFHSYQMRRQLANLRKLFNEENVEPSKKDALILLYSHGCLACTSEELGIRKKINQENLEQDLEKLEQDLKEYVSNLEFFEKQS